MSDSLGQREDSAVARVHTRHEYADVIPYEPGRPWNLGAVDRRKTIYRCAAPALRGLDPELALTWLRDEGVRTIVMLNQTEQGIDADEEIEVIERLGMNHERFNWEQMLEQHAVGREPEWERWKEIVLQGRCCVHCVWGVDRTGATVARFRLESFGWSPRDAFEELRVYGYAFEREAEALHSHHLATLEFIGYPLEDYEPLRPDNPDHKLCVVRHNTAIG